MLLASRGHALDDSLCLLRVLLWQDHQKLIPAPPADDVIGAAAFTHGAGDLLNHPVARQVTEGVIDQLQPVEVAHDQGAGILGFPFITIERFLCIPAVVKPRHGIVAHDVFKAGSVFLFFPEVPEHQGRPQQLPFLVPDGRGAVGDRYHITLTVKCRRAG